MPLINYLQDRVAPFWQALTDPQHSAWHFFALANPITNDQGELVTVNGWQMFVHVNSWLAIADTIYMISDPPADLTRPLPFNLRATTWSIKCKQADATTFRNGRIFINVSPAIPTDRLVMVIPAQTFISRLSLHPWAVAHSSYIAPGFSGLHDLTIRNGLSGAGASGLLHLRIVGPWAKGHPRQRAAKLLIISTMNGMRTEGTLLNSKG